MSDPLPPSEAEQAVRAHIDDIRPVDRTPAEVATAMVLRDCARLRAALGEVCGAVDALLDVHSLGTLAYADKDIERTTDNLIAAVKSARSTP